MLEQINTNIFSAINQYAGQLKAVDATAVIIAKYLFCIFILALIYLWLSKNPEKKHYALYAGYSAIVGVLVNFLITVFYFHPRPFMENMGTTLIQHAPETSFPSDHTTFMLSIAMMLLFASSTRFIGIILVIIGLFGGLARVFCGIHFPMDILGSLVVSFFASIIIFLFRLRLEPLNNHIIHVYKRVTNKRTS